jgi:hypothetical protein
MLVQNMSIEATSISEDVKTSVVKKSFTESDLIANRINAHGGGKEPEKSEPEANTESDDAKEVVEDLPQEEPEIPKQEPKVEESENEKVLSQFDLDKLSAEDLQKLVDKTRSKAISRYGELTAEKKAMQAQIAQLQAMIQAKETPKLEVKPQIPEEIAALTSLEELQGKYTEAKTTVKFFEEKLEDSEHLADTDVIAVVNGQEFTKLQAKKIKREAKDLLESALPAQAAELEQRKLRANQREHWNQQARKEIPWLSDKTSDVRVEFEAAMKSPIIQKVLKSVPEAEVDLEYIVAHSLNSIRGGKLYPMANAEPKQVKITPPTSVKNTAVSRGESEIKHTKELEAKAKKSGRFEDFQALREKQLSNKR